MKSIAGLKFQDGITVEGHRYVPAGEVERLRLLLERAGARLNDYEPGSDMVLEINEALGD